MVRQTRVAELPEPFDGNIYSLAEGISKVTLTEALTSSMVNTLCRHPIFPFKIVSRIPEVVE